MKNIDQMTEEEIRAELTKLLERKKKYYGTNKRKELIEKDPRAYFTRPNDFERAERKTEGSTTEVPKFNSFGTLPNRPLQKYSILVVSILDQNVPLLEKENVQLDGEPTYEKLQLNEADIPVESIVYVMDNHFTLWKFEP